MRRHNWWQWATAGIAVGTFVIQLGIGWKQAASTVGASALAAGRLLSAVLWWVWPLLLAVLVIWRGRQAWRVIQGSGIALARRARQRGLLMLVGLGVPLLAGLVVSSVFVLPGVLVPAEATSAPERLVELRNSVRSTLTQAAGGLLVAFGAMATWRQLHVTRERQITERYTRAVDQLGAADNGGQEKIDVQLGGIYALERIARDSPADQPTIVEVLTAYVRLRAAYSYSAEEGGDVAGRAESLQARLPTVQAAMRVLGRLPRPAHVTLELPNVDLRAANLQGANLAGALLADTNLTQAILFRAQLTDAALAGANLTGAVLSGAKLVGAHLAGAKLTRAELVGADVTDTILGSADLSHANMWGADLSGAFLGGANLAGATLRDVNLAGATVWNTDFSKVSLATVNLAGASPNSATKWPEGFDPEAAGVRFDDAGH